MKEIKKETKHMNLEKLIAENMLRFGIKNLNEVEMETVKSKILQEQIKPVDFSFEFAIGTYKLEEVGDAKIAQLYNSLKTICGNIRNPVLANIQTTIVLKASANKMGINPNSQLYKDGITNNTILAQKRLETLETLIRECIKNWIPSITDEEINTNFKFTRSSSVGDSTAINANIVQTGEKLTNLITCSSGVLKFSGVQGTQANNYVGYEYNSLAAFGAGDTVTLTFDSVNIPDAFFIKMDGATEIVSGFRGDLNRGKDLNNNTKYPNLLSKINAKIKSLGGTNTLNSTEVQKGAQQGGQDAFITFLKKPFKDKLKVVVFAPLDRTIFNIKVSCKPGPQSKPLGPPTVASIASKPLSAEQKKSQINALLKDKKISSYVDMTGKTLYYSKGQPINIGKTTINEPKGDDITNAIEKAQ